MMNEENFKKLVAKNLSFYRKANKLTQLELAEKLNYSDKAISKWERGESLPDLYTLNVIAEFFGITINDLCSLTKNDIKVESKKSIKNTTHLLITILSVVLVWFIGTIVFVSLHIAFPHLENNKFWLSFIICIPVTFIVLTVFSCLWFNNFYKALSVSFLVWTIALACNVSISLENTVFVYFIAIPFQVMIILWYTMRTIIKKNKNANIKNEDKKIDENIN